MRINGRTEQWRLEWEKPPLPACEAGDTSWYTCPCLGFAFGERGMLDLVRLYQGQEVERLPLTPLFGVDFQGYGAVAVLRRFEPSKADVDGDPEDPGLAERVRARPSVRIMDLADYDHDGQAKEFLLQVEAEPCGTRLHVAVGVSRADPHLHVLHSLAHPERPLALRLDHWQALRQSAGPMRRGDWPCDYQGQCTQEGKRGRLLREEDR